MNSDKIEYKHESEANISGLILLSHNKIGPTKLYKFISCGHEKRLQPGHVRDGNIKCRVCEEANYSEECKKHGIIIVKHNVDSNPNHKLIKFEACGHERIANLSSCKRGNVFCKICQIARFKENAEINNCKLVKVSTDYRYGFYELPCSHLSEFQHGNIKRGIFKCPVCNESYTSKESFVYVLKVSGLNLKFIKIGFTANLERRIGQIITNGVEIQIVAYKKFNTGKNAENFESRLHCMFRKHRLEYELSRKVLRSGWTECYEYCILDDLISHFEGYPSAYLTAEPST